MAKETYSDSKPKSSHEAIVRALTRLQSRYFEAGKAAQGLLVLEHRLRVRHPEGPALLRAMTRDIQDGIAELERALAAVQP